MKKILILLFILGSIQLNAQENFLIVKNIESNKEKSIKENKRIKIKTLSGDKLVGRLKIIDKETIMLGGVAIPLAEIVKVKKHPLIGSIGNSVGFATLAMGTAVMGAGLSGATLAGGEEDPSNIPIFVGIGLSITCIYASTQPINLFDKGYSVNKKWKFEIVVSSSVVQNPGNRKIN